MKKALLMYSKLHFDPTKETLHAYSSAGIIAKSLYKSLIDAGFAVDYIDHSEVNRISNNYDLFLAPPLRWTDAYKKANSKINILFLGTTHPSNRNKKMIEGKKRWKTPFLEDILTSSYFDEKYFVKTDYIFQIGNQKTVDILVDNKIPKDKIVQLHYGLDFKINETKKESENFLNNYLYTAACFGLRKGFTEIVKIFSSDKYLKKKLSLVGSICKTDNFDFWNKRLEELEEKNNNVIFNNFVPAGTDDYEKTMSSNAWYVLPSLEEGEPGTVIEAMSAGIVPILSKECNIDFEIDDEFDITFEKKLEKTLFINEERWDILSKKSKHYASIFHDYSFWEKRLTEIFKNIKLGENILMPKVSIILTIYNKEESIQELISLLWENTKSYLNWDIHVIFDGCNDKSKVEAEKILKNFSIPIFEYETPDVFEIKANNLGLRNAKGKYCVIIQDDNYIQEKGWLEKMISWMELNPKVAVLGGLAGVNFFPLENENKGKGANKSLFENHQRLDPKFDKNLNNFIFEVDAVMRGPLILRKELLEKYGYLDEEYCPLYNDDMDLCFKMRENGYSIFCYPIDVINKSLTIAKYNNPEKTKFWKETMEKNQKRFYNKWKGEIGKNHEIYLKIPKPKIQKKQSHINLSKIMSNLNFIQKIYEVRNTMKNIYYKLFTKTPKPIIDLIIKTAQTIGGKFTGLSKKIHLHYYQRRNIQWIISNGDKTLRLDYPLEKSSIVFDLGGYKGNWSKDIYCLYGCNIYIFEPMKKFADEIKEKFKHNEKIHIYNFGLSDENKNVPFSADNISSSEYKASKNDSEVTMKNITEFIETEGIEKIDLLKINIEGGEYPVLEKLIKENCIKSIENIQVQFHDFIPNAKERMASIQKELKKTHDLTYQEEFVWENWKLKDKIVIAKA